MHKLTLEVIELIEKLEGEFERVSNDTKLDSNFKLNEMTKIRRLIQGIKESIGSLEQIDRY